jgi:hypothetical protein
MGIHIEGGGMPNVLFEIKCNIFYTKPEQHRRKTSAHAQELKMANILNCITQNKNMAIYSLDISETNNIN